MIDLTTYRSRIGTFSQNFRYPRKFKNSLSLGNITNKLSRKEIYMLVLINMIITTYIIFDKTQLSYSEFSEKTIKLSQKFQVQEYILLCLTRFYCSEIYWTARGDWFLCPRHKSEEYIPLYLSENIELRLVKNKLRLNCSIPFNLLSESYHGVHHVIYMKSVKNKLRLGCCIASYLQIPLQVRRLIISHNFWARYIYGNKSENKRGIKNIHLNIRSLNNKVFEVKNIVKIHDPHILGLSECELRKREGVYDESHLKVPGYKILFPKSWSQKGYARILVYVKKSFQVEQLIS